MEKRHAQLGKEKKKKSILRTILVYGVFAFVFYLLCWNIDTTAEKRGEMNMCNELGFEYGFDADLDDFRCVAPQEVEKEQWDIT